MSMLGEREPWNAGGSGLLSAARLVREVTTVLSRKARPGRHHIAAGLLTMDGGCFTAINLVSNLGAASSCAEQAALATALQATTSPITLVVSLRATFDQARRNEIIPPCGRCRELLLEYAPSADVVLAARACEPPFTITPITELLPFPFRRRRGGHG